MEMLQGAWKQHLRPRAVVGYGVKIFLPSLPNYVTRSPGRGNLESILSFICHFTHFSQAKSLVSEFKSARQLLNPVSLLKFDAIDIRSCKEGQACNIITLLFY